MACKIAYLCSSDSWGGLEMNQLRNAIWMNEKGKSVCVLALFNSPIYIASKENKLDTISILKHRKYFDFIAAYRLVSIIKKEKITHLIIRSTRDMSITASVKFILGKTINTAYFMEMQLGVMKKNIFHSIRFKGIDRWFCPLSFLADQVSFKTNYKTSNIRVLGSGIDLSKINKLDRNIARKNLGLPIDVFLLGLPGRIDPQKGQKLLLNALEEVDQSNIHLVLMGNSTINEGNSYENEILSIIKKNNWSKKIHLIGHQSDMSNFYSAINCMVMASKSETFGMVTLESLAYEVQVIGSNAGGTPELLGNGEFGYLFESQNAKSLAKNILNAYRNKKNLSKSKLNAHLAKFDHHFICEKIENELSLKN